MPQPSVVNYAHPTFPRAPTLSGGRPSRLCPGIRDLSDISGSSQDARVLKKFDEGANRCRAHVGATKLVEQLGRLLQLAATPNREERTAAESAAAPYKQASVPARSDTLR